MAASRSLAMAVIAGVVAGIAVLGLMEAEARYIHETSQWKSTINFIFGSLTPLVPGVTAGFLAARSGFAAGAGASVITSIVYSAYIAQVDSRSVMENLQSPIIPNEVTFAVLALVVGGVCGIAGAAIARDRRNAF